MSDKVKISVPNASFLVESLRSLVNEQEAKIAAMEDELTTLKASVKLNKFQIGDISEQIEIIEL